jgi:hypothetical protein
VEVGIQMQRSKLVLGMVVALGVGGLGASAFALENATGGSGGVGSDTTTTLAVDPSTTVPTAVAPTTTLAPIPDPAPATDEPAGDPATTDWGVERSTDGCDGGTYANHGDYVSSVAQGEDRKPGDVPAGAQSNCGKPLTSVSGDHTGSALDAPETEAPTTGGDGESGGPGKGKGASDK